MEGKKKSHVPSSFKIQLDKYHENPIPGNKPLWLEYLPSGPAAQPLVLPFLFLKSICG